MTASNSANDLASQLVLSQTDVRPMYRQIQSRIQQLVAANDWESGWEIPSIRQLSIALKVSVITVKRAYFELERDGVIITRHGKGSVVAPRSKAGENLKRKELNELIAQVKQLAGELGLSNDELAGEFDADAKAATEKQENSK